MDNNASLLLDLLTLACGGYCMYTWVNLRILNRLFKNELLVPKDCKPEDCLDEEGYIAYIRPRLFVLSALVVLTGVIFVLNDVLASPVVPYPWSIIPWALVLVALVWYAISNRHANREYFGL